MAESTEDVRALSPEEVAEASMQGAVLLDLRDIGLYCEEHLPGAIFIAFNPRSLPKHVASVVPEGAKIVLTGDEDRVRQVAAWAAASGGPDSLGWLEGGLNAWKASGRPVEALPRMTVKELHERWTSDSDSFELIDVREPFEWNLGTIEGSKLISLGELIARIDEIPKDRELVFICEQGTRSATAAALFASRGNSQVSNVEGGFGTWFKAGYSVVE